MVLTLRSGHSNIPGVLEYPPAAGSLLLMTSSSSLGSLYISLASYQGSADHSPAAHTAAVSAHHWLPGSFEESQERKDPLCFCECLWLPFGLCVLDLRHSSKPLSINISIWDKIGNSLFFPSLDKTLNSEGHMYPPYFQSQFQENDGAGGRSARGAHDFSSFHNWLLSTSESSFSHTDNFVWIAIYSPLIQPLRNSGNEISKTTASVAIHLVKGILILRYGRTFFLVNHLKSFWWKDIHTYLSIYLYSIYFLVHIYMGYTCMKSVTNKSQDTVKQKISVWYIDYGSDTGRDKKVHVAHRYLI